MRFISESIFLFSYLLIANSVSFALYGSDKRRAIQKRWRIPEGVLLISALAGGSLGALIAMRLFHHKTRRLPFAILVPLFLLIHVALIAYYLLTC